MNFKKFISIFVLSTLLLHNMAFAQIAPEPTVKDLTNVLPLIQLLPEEKDPGSAISPMKRGQRTPFTGVLFSPAAVATVIVEIESFQERLHIEVMKSIFEERAAGDKKLNDIIATSNVDKKILQSNLDAAKRETDAFKTELNVLKDSQSNPYLWTGIGTVSGIALTLLTVFAVTQVTK